MVCLVKINEENWRLGLHVSDSQKHFVADSNAMLARAFAYRESRSEAYVIYDEDIPVGMVMYYDCDDLDAYDLSQMFIDERYQRKGYGKAAVQLVLDKMRQDGKYSKVFVCYIEGNTVAKNLYEKFGFVECERDGDEIVMKLDFQIHAKVE